MWRGASFFIWHLQWPHHLRDTTYIHSLTWLALSQNYTHILTKCGVHTYSTPSDMVPCTIYHGPHAPRISKAWNQSHFTLISLTSYTVNVPRATWQEPTTHPLPNLQCSGVGVIPKKDGSWHMIMHLSAPHLNTINDGIDKQPYSLHYSTIDNATWLIAKIDIILSAFCLILVNRQDWELLGVHWRGSYYMDKQLPFELRSAPFLLPRHYTGLSPTIIMYLIWFITLMTSYLQWGCEYSELRHHNCSPHPHLTYHFKFVVCTSLCNFSIKDSGGIPGPSRGVGGVQLVTHSPHTLPIQDCLVLFPARCAEEHFRKYVLGHRSNG